MAKIEELLDLMARLRNPDGGCPWDLEQTFETIAPYTIEEAYEVDHAIQQNDAEGLCDELGDLLLQIVFHARIADEAGLFDFSDVVNAICSKLVRRHPHVFPQSRAVGERAPRSAEEQTRFWEAQKARERAHRGGGESKDADLFEGIPHALPALARAAKLQKRARESGLDGGAPGGDGWGSVREMIRREIESTSGDDRRAAIGALLALCVDVSKEQGVDPEAALREFNQAFEQSVRGRIR